MAAPSSYLIQDQNISIHYDGASLVGKNGMPKAQKKGGGVGGRKALNDISNSAKPAALQSSKKHNSANVISIGTDLDASRNNYSKGPEKKGGRKALTDLTNSSKSSVQLVSKKGLNEHIPADVAKEQFVHNHQKCINAQRKAMDIGCFLKEVGLDNDVPVHLAESPNARKLLTKSKPSSTYHTPVKKHFEVKEMPEPTIYDQILKYGETEACGYSSSPYDASPKSAKPSYMSWNDDSVLHFALIGTPNQPKF